MTPGAAADNPHPMTRLVSLLLGLLILIQLIRPFGLPGLRRRADAWKLAVLAFAVVMATAVLRPQ